MSKELSPDQLPGLSVLIECLKDYTGFYFYPNKPITRNIATDNAVVAPLLDQERLVSAQRVLTYLTKVMLESNKCWLSLLGGGPSAFWLDISQRAPAGPTTLTPLTLQQIILALVKGRARFLVRYSHKEPDDADCLLIAYTQHLLNSFESLGRDTVAGQPILWRLSAQDISQARRDTAMHGPIRVTDKGKYVLSPLAQNLLYPVGEFTSARRTKPNLMGLAREIIQGQAAAPSTANPPQGSGPASLDTLMSSPQAGSSQASQATPAPLSARSSIRRRPSAATPVNSPLSPPMRGPAKRRASMFWPQKKKK